MFDSVRTDLLGESRRFSRNRMVQSGRLNQHSLVSCKKRRFNELFRQTKVNKKILAFGLIQIFIFVVRIVGFVRC